MLVNKELPLRVKKKMKNGCEKKNVWDLSVLEMPSSSTQVDGERLQMNDADDVLFMGVYFRSVTKRLFIGKKCPLGRTYYEQLLSIKRTIPYARMQNIHIETIVI